MEAITVKDLMVPLSEYATVSEDATLSEAVIALEEANQEFDQNRFRHRAILIYDKNKNIVGKVSQNDVIMSLETKYKDWGIRLAPVTPISCGSFKIQGRPHRHFDPLRLSREE